MIQERDAADHQPAEREGDPAADARAPAQAQRPQPQRRQPARKKIMEQMEQRRRVREAEAVIKDRRRVKKAALERSRHRHAQIQRRLPQRRAPGLDQLRRRRAPGQMQVRQIAPKRRQAAQPHRREENERRRRRSPPRPPPRGRRTARSLTRPRRAATGQIARAARPRPRGIVRTAEPAVDVLKHRPVRRAIRVERHGALEVLRGRVQETRPVGPRRPGQSDLGAQARGLGMRTHRLGARKSRSTDSSGAPCVQSRDRPGAQTVGAPAALDPGRRRRRREPTSARSPEASDPRARPRPLPTRAEPRRRRGRTARTPPARSARNRRAREPAPRRGRNACRARRGAARRRSRPATAADTASRARPRSPRNTGGRTAN